MAILKERRIELAFENKRWFDLLRYDKVISVMNEYGSKLKGDSRYYYLSSSTCQIEENDLLFPIYFREIQVNPYLTQNLGYY